MDNALLERYVQRLKAAGGIAFIRSHWSSRAFWAVHRVGRRLGRFAPWLSPIYDVVTAPLLRWLEWRQSRLLRDLL